MFRTLLIAVFSLLSAAATAQSSLIQAVQPHREACAFADLLHGANLVLQEGSTTWKDPRGDPDCGEAPMSSGFAELAHPVNMILQDGMTTWKDPRGPLMDKASQFYLSTDEIMQIRAMVGYVMCPGNNTSFGESVGTAIVVGDGAEIVTQAHIFIDPDTNKRIEPLEDCVFVNFTEPHQMAKLDFSSNRTYKFYTNSPKAEWYNDRAVVHLKGRITGSRPFTIDDDATPINRGDKLIVISATQKQLTFPMAQYQFKTVIGHGKFLYQTKLNREPIAQGCTAMSYYPASSSAFSAVYTDCSATVLASGSPIFVRRNGVLHAKAQMETAGSPASDYKPFKVGKGVPDSELSFSVGVGLDSGMNSDIAQIKSITNNSRKAEELPQ